MLLYIESCTVDENIFGAPKFLFFSGLLSQYWTFRDNYCYCDSWKSDNYTGSNTEKKPRINIQIRFTKWSKEAKSDNLCNSKVGRVITIRGAIRKRSHVSI